jgi:glycosyltransferase involved in cell wall biosynthesis
MKLLIVSHTPHHERAGVVVGWGPTVTEIDHLATRFAQVTHVAPVHAGEPPPSDLHYRASNLRFVRVPPTGGVSVRAKLGVLRTFPQYARVLWREMNRADVVHIRCPASISLLALLLLIVRRSPRLRWFKFAGNWQPETRDALSYRVQRWILTRNLARGVVTVNGRWQNQPAHIFSFLNPSLTETEIAQARALIGTKRLQAPIRLVFVGRTEESKGLSAALRATAELAKQHMVLLDVIGDSPSRPDFERMARDLGITDQVSFRGFLPRTEIAPYYRDAHFILFPSHSEGWPKVLSEAMAYGAVPVTSRVSSIPQVLDDLGCGASIPPSDEAGFVTAIEAYLREPERWRVESQHGREAVHRFSYEHFLTQVATLFRQQWGITLSDA